MYSSDPYEKKKKEKKPYSKSPSHSQLRELWTTSENQPLPSNSIVIQALE